MTLSQNIFYGAMSGIALAWFILLILPDRFAALLSSPSHICRDCGQQFTRPFAWQAERRYSKHRRVEHGKDGS